MKNEIFKESKFTKKNSVQRFHYGKFRGKGRDGNPNEYWFLLKKHNLREEIRDDPSGYYHEGEALSHLKVAPIFDKHANKICWGMYWQDNSCSKFKTKKDAMSLMKEYISGVSEEPWYSDLPGYDTPQGVYLSDGVYGHKDWKFTGNI